jgi:uncharacterized membrane protein
MNQLILVGAMACAAVLGSLGQICLKKLSDVPLRLMPFSWFAWGFIGLYGLATIINVLAYKFGGKASILYPVIATSYVWVMILAALFLSEPLTTVKIIGAVVIVIGVALIAFGG